jgi:hypothetical protein
MRGKLKAVFFLIKRKGIVTKVLVQEQKILKNLFFSPFIFSKKFLL